MKKVKVLIGLLACFGAHSFGVNAAESFQDCIVINDETKRLACFDRVAKTQQKSKKVDKEELEVEIKPTIKEVQPKLETMPLKVVPTPVKPIPIEPRNTKSEEQLIEEFGSKQLKKEVETEPESIFATVKGVSKSIRGRLKLTFENGQYWEQTDSAWITIKPGDKVEIIKGVFSVYYLKKVSANRKIKVKRIK